ncbi:MAG TPA: hypothetical protein VMK32_10340 [Burkholderiaceae bacterium]|nr:hypothetical protein [Burkholderiaceae bacterium]
MKAMKLSTLAAAVALAVPFAAHAESNFTTGGGANITATARVNFSVVIPKFVFLQVGTGPVFPAMSANATIDTITFNVPAANVGDGTVINATAGSGNLGNGAVTVRVVGNNGNMTLGATGPATLTSGTDTLAWTQIATAVTGGATHPPVNGAAVTYTATNKVVNVNGTWTYTYLNAAPLASGTYTGQVLYTATTP